MLNKRDFMKKMSFCSFLALSLLLAAISPVFAQSDEEKNFLLMYFKEEELVVETPTRSPKPVSQIAENVTVVTAADIELMNAHSLAEVLNTITGVQVWMTGGPGQIATAFIQGSETRHVTVFIDGVALNNLEDNSVELGMIPVQNIEKIEIIKGPASSTWGSALGGVVNIITKSGKSDNSGGMVSASYGTKNTGDFRAEARGKQDRFGYYLTAGALHSNGLTTHMDLSEYNAYTKLSYDVTDNTAVLYTLGYEKISRNTGAFEIFDVSLDNSAEILHSTLAVDSALSKNMGLNVSVRTITQKNTFDTNALSSGLLLEREQYIDRGYGASAKLTWKDAFQTIVLGADYDNKWLNSDQIVGNEQGIKKWAVFVNDTLLFNRLSITPGGRYEHTDTSGNIADPSLGMTYNLADNTILRAYAAKGFSIPPLGETFINTPLFDANPDLKVETVTSYEAGVETAAMKFLWVKMSIFQHEIRDAISTEPSPIDPGKFTLVNEGRQRRQGLEIEAKTAPVYNFSVSAGAEFIDAKNLNTGTKLRDIPSQIYDLGLHYNDERTITVLLQGRYINWNTFEDDQGSYGSFIFDLSMIKKILQQKGSSLEAFAAVHNIFNNSQYLLSLYKNPDRWFEGGLRYKF